MTPIRYLWAGIALLVMSMVLGAAAVSGVLKSADTTTFKALAMTDAKSSDALIAMAQFFTLLGDPGWRAALMIVILIVLVYRRCWRSATVFVVTVGLSISGHSVAKEAFGRSRPTLVPQLDFVDTYAYPSGHAAGAMVILLLGALLLRNRGAVWLGVILSLAIGLSRVALGVHWPSDVIGGWMFGGGAALIGYATAQSVKRPKESVN